MCFLCGEHLDAGEIVVVTRGLETLRKSSLARCDGIHHALEGLNVATVHVRCRKNYTRRPDAAAAPSSSTTTVSESIFCAQVSLILTIRRSFFLCKGYQRII